MNATLRTTLWLALLAFAGSCTTAGAQSIAFSPAMPLAGDTIDVTFTQSFDCAAPTPSVTSISSAAITFDSTLPYGIVHCPVIPFPPPKTSMFEVPLGALGAGSYTVTWNRYQAQASGAPLLLSSTSATLDVGIGNRGAGTQVASAPALSLPAYLALATLCLLAGGRRLRTRPRGASAHAVWRA